MTSSGALACYRCGAPLTGVPLPLSRREECPSCRAELHVCRMCTHYAPRLHRGCDEDDAPDVRDKETANFCDYFKPSPYAFDGGKAATEAAARAELARLFGEAEAEAGAGKTDAEDESPEEAQARRAAEALFKR